LVVADAERECARRDLPAPKVKILGSGLDDTGRASLEMELACPSKAAGPILLGKRDRTWGMDYFEACAGIATPRVDFIAKAR
jgi:hypothetical protein